MKDVNTQVFIVCVHLTEPTGEQTSFKLSVMCTLPAMGPSYQMFNGISSMLDPGILRAVRTHVDVMGWEGYTKTEEGYAIRVFGRREEK